MGSGDGWTVCASGHRHWGRYGAAGLFVTDGERVILQHRAAWTHEGDSWGIPGGARDAGESAVETALREAREEAGLDARGIEPVGLYIVDHGGWSYTTVVARPRAQLRPYAANSESISVEWVGVGDVQRRTLHNGFAAAWPELQDIPDPVRLVIEAGMAGAEELADLGAHGLAADRLPIPIRVGSLHRLLIQSYRVGMSRLDTDGGEAIQELVILHPTELLDLR